MVEKIPATESFDFFDNLCGILCILSNVAAGFVFLLKHFYFSPSTSFNRSSSRRNEPKGAKRSRRKEGDDEEHYVGLASDVIEEERVNSSSISDFGPLLSFSECLVGAPIVGFFSCTWFYFLGALWDGGLLGNAIINISICIWFYVFLNIPHLLSAYQLSSSSTGSSSLSPSSSSSSSSSSLSSIVSHLIRWAMLRLELASSYQRTHGTTKLLFQTIIASFHFFVSTLSSKTFHPGMKCAMLVGFSYWGWFFYHHTLRLVGQDYMTGGAMFADMAIHVDISTSFLWGVNQRFNYHNITNPTLAETRLVYPFMPDFQAASFVAAGTSMRQAIMIPSIFLGTSFVGLIYGFNLRFTGSSIASWISIPLVTWAGGTGYRKFIKKLISVVPATASLSLFSPHSWGTLMDGTFWKSFYEIMLGDDFTQFDNEGESFWFSLTAHVFLPQRSSVYSYPAALFIFCLLMRSRTHTISPFDKSASDRYLWSPITRQGKQHLLLLGGFLAGLLPLFQAHGYVGVGFVAGWFAVFEFLFDVLKLLEDTLTSSPRIPLFLRKFLSRFLSSSSSPSSFSAPPSSFTRATKKGSGSSLWRRIYDGWVGECIIDWFFFFVTLLLVSAPQVPLFMSRVQSSGGFLMRGNWIFRGNTLRQALNFWFHALHYCLHFSLLAVLGMNLRMMRVYIGFVLLFVLSNYVQFQPWVKDNIKMVYIWLFAASGATGNLALCFYCLLDKLLCFTYQSFSRLLGSSPPSPSPSSLPRSSSSSSLSSFSFARLSLGQILKTCIRITIILWIGYQLFFLIFTGGLTAAKETQLNYRFYGTDEMATGLFIRDNTPPTAIFLTSAQHINPTNCIGGRQQLYGYGGWMWSHGLSSISGPRQGTASHLLRCGSSSPHSSPSSSPFDTPSGEPSPSLVPSSQVLDAINQLKVEYVTFDLDMKEDQHRSCVSTYAVKVFQSFPSGYFSIWKVHPKYLKWKTSYEHPGYPWHIVHVANETKT